MSNRVVSYALKPCVSAYRVVAGGDSCLVTLSKRFNFDLW
jgi:hypothetical protein